ncbi:MAG TPA: hypothetical protein VGW38_22015, partial [Chloroflexota bacterium]|nr:hypothetical protein [Chloroflexota bacterium]
MVTSRSSLATLGARSESSTAAEAAPPPRARRPARAVSVLVALVLAALMVWVARPLWLPAVGAFLVVRDPLVPTDAIVVLAGSAPQRLRHALALYHAGYAPRVVVSNER